MLFSALFAQHNHENTTSLLALSTVFLCVVNCVTSDFRVTRCDVNDEGHF